MFIGVAIGVIGKKLVHDDIVTVVGILLALAGMFMTAYPYLAPSRRRLTPAGLTTGSSNPITVDKVSVP